MTKRPTKDAAKDKLPEERSDGKEFERLTALARKIIAVPKSEIAEKPDSPGRRARA